MSILSTIYHKNQPNLSTQDIINHEKHQIAVLFLLKMNTNLICHRCHLRKLSRREDTIHDIKASFHAEEMKWKVILLIIAFLLLKDKPLLVNNK